MKLTIALLFAAGIAAGQEVNICGVVCPNDTVAVGPDCECVPGNSVNPYRWTWGMGFEAAFSKQADRIAALEKRVENLLLRIEHLECIQAHLQYDRGMYLKSGLPPSCQQCKKYGKVIPCETTTK